MAVAGGAIGVLVVAKDVVGFALLLYLLFWALAIAFMLCLAGVIIVSRGSSDAARNVFRQAVTAGSARDSLHVAGDPGSPVAVAAALAKLQAADPGFDPTAFLDSARMAVGAYAMAYLAEDDRLLRRVTTPAYWQTPNGKAITSIIAEWRRYAGDRPGTTNRGRILLDMSWREPEVRNVALAERGMDRITVRLGSVIVGTTGPGPGHSEATQFDWDFVRPAGQRTDPGAVMLPRTCARCGGPYRSDLDDACHYCHATRADTQAGWRLDCTYQVVDA
jgi:hypothetical protein